MTQTSNLQGFEPDHSWQGLIERALREKWADETVAAKAKQFSLPELPPGFPVLIRVQNCPEETCEVVKNLIPKISVFARYSQDLFMLVHPEAEALKDLQAWGEAIIPLIHTMLAEELGVLAHVYVGRQVKDSLWSGVKEVYSLAEIKDRFLPAEIGLVAWKTGLAGLLDGCRASAIDRFEQEVLNGQLTADLLETLQVYFSHGLSISETAKHLFIHRNTLLYRLDRITELTGYNPRRFKDAVNLYLALWLGKSKV